MVPRLAELCEQWVRPCPVCRAVKARSQASAAWRSERYAAPMRCLQIDLVGPATDGHERLKYAMAAIGMRACSSISDVPGRALRTAAHPSAHAALDAGASRGTRHAQPSPGDHAPPPS